ncbi:MAG: HAMP domain-containing histidine kinase [Ruminococcaceae bacterium]|nr:HAMP domain-containing histidine kinase [Oscillospiraceae bacterium]
MKSTFGRLFTVITLVLLASLVLIGVSFQWLSNRHLVGQAISSLENDAKVIASLYKASYQNKDISSQDFYMALTVAVSVSQSDAIICDADGKLVLCADAPMGCEHIGLQLEEGYRKQIWKTGGFTDSGIIRGLYEENRYLVSVAVTDDQSGTPLGIVLVSAPVDAALSTMRGVSSTFFFIAIIVLVVSLVVMIFVVRRQANPLRDMAKAARAFGHGDFDARVVTSGHNPQEVEELALAFNNMAASLEKSEYQRQEFVANISHELKTPMTTISGYVDGILDGTIPPEKSEHYLQMVSVEAKRLSRLVRSMLDVSRLQDQQVMDDSQKSRFDIVETAGQVLISFEQKINEKRLRVEVDIPEHGVYTFANQDAIIQVLYNLVDNGVKFCPEEGAFGITIREAKQKVYLCIWNEGEDIPAQELPLVFERFHKIDKSRSQNRDSWGLGLYIVKTIINSHGENISVSSNGGKTEFSFTLPLVL